MPEPEIWDEERWEAFLRENDRRTDRYMELMYGFLRRHPRPDLGDVRVLERWKNRLRAFLRDRGWRREDIILPFLWLEQDPGHPLEDLWLADEGAPLEDPMAPEGGFSAPVDSLDSFEHLPIYQQAESLASAVLDWADALADAAKTSTLVHFCSCITQIPANVARGHGLGYEVETLGGNIACVKRALAAANAALRLLHELKGAPHLSDERYRALYEDVYEMRNALGTYVQDLRARFNLGID
jgi:hypothetical protein